MCFAVPLRLLEVDGSAGVCMMSGVSIEVRLDLLEDARPGDYVLVHAGFAIQLLDEDEAETTISMIGEMLEKSEREPSSQ